MVLTQNTMITAVLAKGLENLAELLENISDDDFTYKGDGIIEGSIGEHVRHILDHVGALVKAAHEVKGTQQNVQVCYDRRQRGTPIEQDRALCLQSIVQHIESLNALSGGTNGSNGGPLKAREIEIEHIIDKGGQYSIFVSYLEREFMFVYHHLMHHTAIIAIRLRLLGAALSSDLGVAPATLAQNALQNSR